MVEARRAAWRLARLLGGGGLTLLFGGCQRAAAPGRGSEALPPSPVALQCERTADSVLRVMVRNRTGRAADVDPIGLAYAGQGMWDH